MTFVLYKRFFESRFRVRITWPFHDGARDPWRLRNKARSACWWSDWASISENKTASSSSRPTVPSAGQTSECRRLCRTDPLTPLIRSANALFSRRAQEAAQSASEREHSRRGRESFCKSLLAQGLMGGQTFEADAQMGVRI